MNATADATFGPRLQGHFDFTLLFEQSIFSIGPSAILLTTSLFRITALTRRKPSFGASTLLWIKLIPTKSSEHYYRQVNNLFPDTQYFYRYFEAPGLGHCVGGGGGHPLTIFDALRSWVEEVYQGGDVSDSKSFKCIGNATGNLGNSTDV
ncbi:uncharacterized protein N7487_002541 [Penicillium crustosum]|uniref:uncharacterized protein n=1 Tax=Penicillium crustosum TaxID=36656 RepID=UPI00238A3767|nr:uncharacterized protein N7487_002541 [Penicillium crustosum]KAJ5418991.1 hypothetical protein N7487_002541 [Penicillium crustosum]